MRESAVTVGPARRTSVQLPATAERDGLVDRFPEQLVGTVDLPLGWKNEEACRDAVVNGFEGVLDLRDLVSTDDAGVCVIVDASRAARRRGHRLLVVRGCGPVDVMLILSGWSDELEVVDLDPAEPPVQALLQLAQDPATGENWV